MLPEDIIHFLDTLLSRERKPPKFKKHAWKTSDSKKLSVRFDAGNNCREEINDCLNCNVPIETGVNSYAVFEIINTAKKSKRSVVTARIRYPAFTQYLPTSDHMTLEESARYEMIEQLPDGTKVFTEKLTGEPDVDGWVTSSSKITIRSHPTVILPSPKPGEVTIHEEWCYDPLPNVTDENNILGASLSLTCQPITNNGEACATPWRIKIRNYTLVRSGTSFKQVDIKEDYVLLSTDQFYEIDKFLTFEQERHMLFNIVQAITETPPTNLDTENNTEEIS